jgi:AraC-like DNA-binding protein
LRAFGRPPPAECSKSPERNIFEKTHFASTVFRQWRGGRGSYRLSRLRDKSLSPSFRIDLSISEPFRHITMAAEDDLPGRRTAHVLRHRFTRFADAEQFLEKNHDAVTIRPIGPRFDAETTLLLAGDLRLWSVKSRSGYDVAPGARPPRYWVFLPTHGSIDARFGSKSESLSEGHGWMRDTDGLESIRKQPALWETSFDMPREVVHDRLARIGEREPIADIRSGGMIDTTRGNGRMVSKLVRTMISGVDNGMDLCFSARAAKHFSNLVIDLLVHGIVLGHSSQAPRVEPERVRRAVDFLEANLQQPFTIMDVAEAAGVGPRALQAAFRRHFGCSPLAYARQRRLAGVRYALMNRSDHETIGDIAARWGFFHLGLFARQYREAYGEPPSATQRL